jgi:hypothetical protein
MYIPYYYILFTERLQGVFVNFCEDFKFGFVGGFAHVVGEGLAPPEICKNIR